MLYRLLKSEKHTHCGLFSPKANAGFSTTENGHKHLIVVDSMDNRIVTPADDGHTHQLEEYTKEDKEPKKDEEVVAEQIKLFKEAQDFMQDAIEEAEEDENFIHHKQWDDAILEKLRQESKAIATINHIEPMMDILSGFQRQNRQDLKYNPVEEGDQVVADILNVVVKVLLTINRYPAHETEVFENEAGVGMGVFNVYLDYSKNLKGEIVIESFPWKDVRFGPHYQKDLRDCEYQFKLKWYSKAKIKQLYPDKAKNIGPYAIDPESDGNEETHHNARSSLYWEDAHGKIYGAKDIFNDEHLYDGQKKLYRVLERWQKEFIRMPVIVFLPTEEAFNVEGISKDDLNKFKKNKDIKIFYRETHKMRVIQTAGNILLSDEYPDLAYNDFHLVPIFGKHIVKDGKLSFSGKVRGAKDPQRVINKNFCQVIDNVSRVNNSILFYDDDTFGGDKALENEFKERGTSPGHIQKVSSINKLPQRLDPPPIHSAAVQTMQVSSELFQKVTNVNAEALGQESNATSGRAIMMRKQGTMMGNEYLFDNLSLGKQQLGRIIVAMLQKAYSPKRLYRILVHANEQEPITFSQQGQQQQLMQKYPPQAIMELLNTSDLTKYDIAVSESPYNSTTRQSIFWSLVEAAQRGAQIPPTLLIKYTDMTQADKQEALMYLQGVMQQQQQMEQLKYATEIEKSNIAARSKSQGNNNNSGS